MLCQRSMLIFLSFRLLLYPVPLQAQGSSPVIVRVEEPIVNASEGTVAAVCVVAGFPPTFEAFSINEELVTVNISIAAQGSASAADYGTLPSSISFSLANPRRCFQIQIINDLISEGVETFTVELSNISTSLIGIESNAIQISPRMNRTVVRILETCYKGELRLRGGYDVNQGRVEICFNGVWGTVCGDGGWEDGGRLNAQVVCRQLGLLEYPNQPLSFTGAIFGPGNFTVPIHLDQVICTGRESDVLSCSHDPIGVHNCRHHQDVSVDCLGRSQVGVPCSTLGDIRLVGGVDQFQGRVEVCTNTRVYSTVCSEGWDNRDAQVVCQQLGFNATSAVATFDALFGLGVGTILYQNVSCRGSENKLASCSNLTGVCTHYQDAGVDCLGRPLPGVAIVGFERTSQDNGNQLAIKEGETLGLCVVLMSGSLPFEIEIPTFSTEVTEPRRKRQAIYRRHFVIHAPLEARNMFGVFLGHNVTRSCFNITAIDDNVSENRMEPVQFRITIDQPLVRALPSSQFVTVQILDDDFNCSVGETRCVDTLRARASCTNEANVCNGFSDCSDGSDEANCTDYCAEAGIQGFNCLSERLCVPQEHRCDGVPDCGIIATDEINGCPDGCIHGDVRRPLLGGASVSEGIVEVCINGTYLPVSLDNGRFSVREATVICRHLGLGNAGIPLSGGRVTVIFVTRQLVKVVCNGTERNVSRCTFKTIAGGRTNQARVRCFHREEEDCNDGTIRLSPNGPSHNEGWVEICYQNIWGAVYDREWSRFDAAVACSQLNFDRSGALPITGVLYGSVDQVPVVLAAPDCVGNETSLFDCRPDISLSPQLGETGFYQDQATFLQNFAAVRCQNYSSSGCNYLDVRLTFRSAESAGILEICNEQRQWSVVCADNPLSNLSTITVICSQLQVGFVRDFVQYSRVPSMPVLTGGRPSTNILQSLACTERESNLTTCRPREPDEPSPGRRKRITNGLPSVCSQLAQINCGVLPRVTFSPPSFNGSYELEIGRRFSLSCSWDQNTYPHPVTFSTSRISMISNQTTAITVPGTLLVLSSRNITFMDEDVYYCGGFYGSEQPFGETTMVSVRGLVGISQSSYIRLSLKSIDRFGLTNSSRELVASIETLIFESISERVPGVHNVDYCKFVNRRVFDVQRKLDRIECKVTQYSDEGEEVRPIVEVTECLGLLLTRIIPFFQNPVNISVSGFCDEETISTESGVTFYWPEALGGQVSTFTCPFNVEVVTTRTCTTGGIWLPFNGEACQSFNSRLNDLLDLFNNLTTDTYETAVSRLSDVVEISENNTNEQNSETLMTVANYSAEFLNFVDDSNVILNNTAVHDMVQLVGSLLQWNPENIAPASSSRVLQSFEELVSHFAEQLSLNQNETFTVPSLVVIAEQRTFASYTREGRSFTISDNQPILDQRMPGQLSSKQDVVIRLPPSLFQTISGRANLGVFFGRYERATLFPVGRRMSENNNSRRMQVCSQVVAATVGQNMQLQNLEQPVIVTLKLQTKQGNFIADGSEACVSWDFKLRNWTTQGCLTSIGENGMVTCHCNHLTNFAVLADVCSRQEDCQTIVRNCRAENISSESGTKYVWPETRAGDVATFPCPLNTRVIVRRRCSEAGVWQTFNENDCGVVNQMLNRLNDSFNNLTGETLEMAVSLFAQAVEQTQDREVEQNRVVLATIANYLTDIAIFVADSNITINSTVVGGVSQVVSYLLQWDPQNLVVDSTSRVVQSFEVVVYLFAQQLTLNDTQRFLLPLLTVVAEFNSVASLALSGRSIAIGKIIVDLVSQLLVRNNQQPENFHVCLMTTGTNEITIDDGARVMPGQLSSDQDAAISLPASLFRTIVDRENVGVFFALYNTPILFPVDGRNSTRARAPRRPEVGSSVLAATVGPGINFSKLQDNVTVVFRLSSERFDFTATGSEVCVSWNFTLQDWTREGCTVNDSQNGLVTCSCNHLTNFGVLVDVCSRQENCQPLNPVVRNLLTFVSFIGMSISIIALVLTIITLLLFKKLREKDASKYHIQLSLAMLFMLVVSLALVAMSVANVTDPYGGCVTVSVLVHYFTLVAVMWMGAEALLMFQKLVIIFTRITKRFMVAVSIVCWTAPIILVLIPLIVDLANGTDIASDIVIHRSNSSEDISFCFLSDAGAFWGAFLVPIFAVLIFNVVVFIWVVVILIRHTRGTATQKKETISAKTMIRLVISISGVMFLFGLTWLFAILTFSVKGLRETFQIFFTVFNSFQGFSIFLFFCVFNKEALESWRELLSCGKYKSKLLHPSQVKFSSSAAKKIPKQTYTSTGSTGVSSSRGKFLSDKSTSDYESSTITKGNIYEKTPLEIKTDLGTDSRADAVKETSEHSQNSAAETTDLTQAGAIPAIKVHMEAEDSTNPTLHQEKSANEFVKKGGKVGNKIASLKARIKRYSTRKASKHHVEEVEVDFHSDSSGHEGSGEEVADSNV